MDWKKRIIKNDLQNSQEERNPLEMEILHNQLLHKRQTDLVERNASVISTNSFGCVKKTVNGNISLKGKICFKILPAK